VPKFNRFGAFLLRGLARKPPLDQSRLKDVESCLEAHARYGKYMEPLQSMIFEAKYSIFIIWHLFVIYTELYGSEFVPPSMPLLGFLGYFSMK
jgi:hypothetical protein